ncbi:Hsp20/alpha crystallin family protein [Aquisalimonas lutea]|uniref:Hsp20/alpha crystallin family protein n=1 Tax=Aquisalimonas lutea TaxID=1327750 RepID=UPI0025B4988E|nr:Hsp20/alpha crystallin family protein [Aquisalimonas lutea]MDN3516824.1 Hsp20/alpha crystallin family protein [Aquisalimonas lutea]
MKTFDELRQGLEHAWDQAVEGWRHLRDRAGAALTRFYPLRPRGQTPTREEAHARRGASWGLLAAEVLEDDDAVEVRLEAPGMQAGDFDLSVRDQTLIIQGEKRVNRQIDDGRYHVMERAYGAFQRNVPLPSPVDDSGAEASYQEGVLVVRLPRTRSARTRRITVQHR